MNSGWRVDHGGGPGLLEDVAKHPEMLLLFRGEEGEGILRPE